MTRSDLFRVGRVSYYLRGKVWYLRYHEDGNRRQVRSGYDRAATRHLAAQLNAQLENGAPAATSFEPITIPELRRRWLEHHEHVVRSSVATIGRYRTATDHLLRFAARSSSIKRTSNFRPAHAEQFVVDLRGLEVAPNGHENAKRRPLRDKGVKFVLEVCRTMFNFALKRRHLPPYTDNPFTVIGIDRIPVEDAAPIVDLTPAQERELLEKCDDWRLPIFLTLTLTGLRPGELTHLLLPDDLDLENGWLHVRNKPRLGWQVKTRNERRIPLIGELRDVLAVLVGNRRTGHDASVEHMVRLLGRDENYLYVATVSSQPVAFLLAYRFPRVDRDQDMLYLCEIAVLPEHRRRGIGSALIQALKQECQGGSVMEVWVGTEADNAAARALYEATGARCQGETYAEHAYEEF